MHICCYGCISVQACMIWTQPGIQAVQVQSRAAQAWVTCAYSVPATHLHMCIERHSHTSHSIHYKQACIPAHTSTAHKICTLCHLGWLFVLSSAIKSTMPALCQWLHCSFGASARMCALCSYCWSMSPLTYQPKQTGMNMHLKAYILIHKII